MNPKTVQEELVQAMLASIAADDEGISVAWIAHAELLASELRRCEVAAARRTVDRLLREAAKPRTP